MASTCRIGWWVGSAFVLVGVLGACSGNSSPTPPTSVSTTTRPAPSSASTSPSGTPDAAAIAVGVYRAMWADWVEAAKTSDYQSPRLADHTASQALLLVSGSLRKASDNHLVARGEPSLAPRVTETAPVAVSINDCVDATQWLNYTNDGRLQNQTPGGKHHVTATVGLLDNRWMVTRLRIGEVGSCT